MNVVNLVTASGDALPILDRIKATVQFQNLESPLLHDFLVVKDLVAPVILGVNFLHQQGLVLDFTSYPVKVHHDGAPIVHHPAHHSTPQSASTVKAAILRDKSTLKELEMDCKDNDAEEDSTIPDFKDTGVYVLPEYTDRVHLGKSYRHTEICSEILQCLMNKVFQGLNFVKVYVDDVFICSGTKDDHIKHLTAVFQRLKDAGLSLRGNKCHIGLSQVRYLGHTFSSKGMMPDDRKVAAVRDWPIPKDAGKVHQFLGLASYYRRYVLHFADIAAPLHNLTPYSHGLLSFGPNAGIFTLDTDASDVGIGAVLEQDGHVIAYVSRALSKSERNYGVI
ncbi:hypothetical protein EMCRGX_G012510 [Ephydatia muelleri]